MIRIGNPLHKPWTNHQVRDLLAMVDRGFENKAIAMRLGRSLSSVQMQCSRLGIRRREQGIKPRRAVSIITPRETVRIMKADVPSYYEIGWRFIGFDGDVCVFEWPHDGIPLRPAMVRMAA